MKERIIFLSTAYLAPVEYYMQLASAKNIAIESQDNYIKQTYRNRCVISSSSGKQVLIIPVSKPSFCKCLIRDISISENINWQQLHWNSIVAAYNSTPFFKYYESVFRPFYEKKQKFLYDFNEKLRELICSLLDISPNIFYTSTYIKNLDSDELDLREKIHPKKSSFIKIFKSYHQVFENRYKFLPNLSIIDLLFNVGTESIFLLNN